MRACEFRDEETIWHEAALRTLTGENRQRLIDLFQRVDAMGSAGIAALLALQDTQESMARAVEIFSPLPDRWKCQMAADHWEHNGGDFPHGYLWGVLVKECWQRGKYHGALLQTIADTDELVKMFSVAHLDGLYYQDPEGRQRHDTWTARTVYRGGRGDPEAVASGMSWTLDREKAQWFADNYWRPPLGQPVVVERQVSNRDLLATWSYECEVVARPS